MQGRTMGGAGAGGTCGWHLPQAQQIWGAELVISEFLITIMLKVKPV